MELFYADPWREGVDKKENPGRGALDKDLARASGICKEGGREKEVEHLLAERLCTGFIRVEQSRTANGHPGFAEEM